MGGELCIARLSLFLVVSGEPKGLDNYGQVIILLLSHAVTTVTATRASAKLRHIDLLQRKLHSLN